MVSYVVVGASRGLGLEWLLQLSKDPNNTVIGLVRSISATQAKLDSAGVKNVHLFAAEMTDNDSLVAAAAEVAKVTPGVDYLIVNGAYMSPSTAGLNPTNFIGKEAELKSEMIQSLEINVIGVIYTINAFVPLVRKGTVKKITVISTGLADTELVTKFNVPGSVVYSSSKAAVNVVVAKYAVELKADGILVFALSPGVVNTRETPPSEEEMKGAMALFGIFQQAYPRFQGPISPVDSVVMQKKVIEDFTLEQTGSFVSHYGNKEWL